VTSYRCVVATRRGGPEVLEVVERELRDPRPDEVRVRVQAASVSLVDVQARQGRGPFQQKASFVPGYAVVGLVDALGDDVAGFAPGDRVAVMTEINGYAEYVYVRRNPILRISDSIDAAAAVTLVLNYLVAYQVLHRRSGVRGAIGCSSSARRGGLALPSVSLGSWPVASCTVSTPRPSTTPWLGMASFQLTLEPTTWRRRSGGPNRTVSTRYLTGSGAPTWIRVSPFCGLGACSWSSQTPGASVGFCGCWRGRRPCG
jgi:hypothetical protein